MTTPETARPADTSYLSMRTQDAYDAFVTACHRNGHLSLPAATAFRDAVLACLPPQASKASEANSPEIPESCPAPASKCHPCGVTTAIPVTVTETARLHEPAASLSVAPAREGEMKCPPGTCRQCDTCRSDPAARVTPPQQEEDRSWEKECEIRANGVVSYPSTASTTGFVYLVPDGRWLTYDQWLILDPSLDRFPSEAAARAALAKAPRPTT